MTFEPLLALCNHTGENCSHTHLCRKPWNKPLMLHENLRMNLKFDLFSSFLNSFHWKTLFEPPLLSLCVSTLPSLSESHCGGVRSWPSWRRAPHRGPGGWWVVRSPLDPGRSVQSGGCTTCCRTAGFFCSGKRRWGKWEEMCEERRVNEKRGIETR